MGMRTVGLVFLLAVLFLGRAASQRSREDWKQASIFDVDAHLNHTLRDAPLTPGERQQIYRLVDSPIVHDTYTDAQREEERKP